MFKIGDIVKYTGRSAYKIPHGTEGIVLMTEGSVITVAFDCINYGGDGARFLGKDTCWSLFNNNLEKVGETDRKEAYYLVIQARNILPNICSERLVVRGVLTPKKNYLNGTVVMSTGEHKRWEGACIGSEDGYTVHVPTGRGKVILLGYSMCDVVTSSHTREFIKYVREYGKHRSVGGA